MLVHETVYDSSVASHHSTRCVRGFNSSNFNSSSFITTLSTTSSPRFWFIRYNKHMVWSSALRWPCVGMNPSVCPSVRRLEPRSRSNGFNGRTNSLGGLSGMSGLASNPANMQFTWSSGGVGAPRYFFSRFFIFPLKKLEVDPKCLNIHSHRDLKSYPVSPV